MLTVRGIYDEGKVSFIDPVPISGRQDVLVTFLTVQEQFSLLPESRLEVLKKMIRDTGLILSPKELTLLELAQAGGTVESIAAELNLSRGTARNRLSSIYSKLGAKNRTEAIKKAIELGILDPVSAFPP